METKNYYFSGSNHAGEIRALSQLGLGIGVSADQVVRQRDGGAERELLRLVTERNDVHLFLDSGAFAEVAFTKSGERYVRNNGKAFITEAAWNKRLDFMIRVTRVAGGHVTVIAPDSVGDQWETIQRLRTHRDKVRKLRALGARIIVPIQRGSWSMYDMDRIVASTLGTNDYVRGIPSSKAAASLPELKQFLAALKADGNNPELHLLGMGPLRDVYADFIAATAGAPLVTCDSCLIRSKSGWHNGPIDPATGKPGPRMITITREAIIAEMTAAGEDITNTAEVKRRTVIRVFRGPDTMPWDAIGITGFEPLAEHWTTQSGIAWQYKHRPVVTEVADVRAA
jgi:hypothetical protein